MKDFEREKKSHQSCLRSKICSLLPTNYQLVQGEQYVSQNEKNLYFQ